MKTFFLTTALLLSTNIFATENLIKITPTISGDSNQKHYTIPTDKESPLESLILLSKSSWGEVCYTGSQRRILKILDSTLAAAMNQDNVQLRNYDITMYDSSAFNLNVVVKESLRRKTHNISVVIEMCAN